MKNKEINKCKKTKLHMTDKTALSVKPFRKKKCVRCRPKSDTLKKIENSCCPSEDWFQKL